MSCSETDRRSRVQQCTVGVGGRPQVNYGVRSSKFIWAPCAQLYTLADTPHLGSYTKAHLVSQDRRHLFVTSYLSGHCHCYLPVDKELPQIFCLGKAEILIQYLVFIHEYSFYLANKLQLIELMPQYTVLYSFVSRKQRAILILIL